MGGLVVVVANNLLDSKCGALLASVVALPFALGACSGGSPPVLIMEEPLVNVTQTDDPPIQTMLAIDWLQENLGDDDRFGLLAMPPGQGGIVMLWHGDAPEEALAEVAALYPDALPVSVAHADLLPGDLRRLTMEILRTERDAGVGAVSINADFTGLIVRVHDDQVPDLLELASRLSSKYGIPVKVEPGAPVGASG